MVKLSQILNQDTIERLNKFSDLAKLTTLRATPLIQQLRCQVTLFANDIKPLLQKTQKIQEKLQRRCYPGISALHKQLINSTIPHLNTYLRLLNSVNQYRNLIYRAVCPLTPISTVFPKLDFLHGRKECTIVPVIKPSTASDEKYSPKKPNDITTSNVNNLSYSMVINKVCDFFYYCLSDRCFEGASLIFVLFFLGYLFGITPNEIMHNLFRDTMSIVLAFYFLPTTNK